MDPFKTLLISLFFVGCIEPAPADIWVPRICVDQCLELRFIEEADNHCPECTELPPHSYYRCLKQTQCAQKVYSICFNECAEVYE